MVSPYYDPSDPYWSSVSLLLHMDGTNGSTTFDDSSDNAYSLSSFGGAAIDTAQAKFGVSSAGFDGSNCEITLPASSTPLNIGTGDFTIDVWIRINATGSQRNIFTPQGKFAEGIHVRTDQTVGWWKDGAGLILVSTSSLASATWHLISVQRSGSTMKLFIDGIEEDSVTNTKSYNFSGWGIGEAYYNTDFDGWLDDFRITKGVARYSADFSPPTSPFPDF